MYNNLIKNKIIFLLLILQITLLEVYDELIKVGAKMIKSIGVPKEIKDNEYRVGLTPAGVFQLVEAGHSVLVEKDAGTKIGFQDEHYKSAGAKIVSSPEEIYECEMIVKVKEPILREYPLLKNSQLLFCFLHLAADRQLTDELLNRKVTAIAYETVTDEKGHLPLLEPMSEIAGRLSIQVGATYLQLNHGGRGVLLGGVPGVPSGNVCILGGGVVGTEAARMAIGLGASVTVIEKDLKRLRYLDSLYGSRINTLYATGYSIQETVIDADLVIGAVLIPGKAAPKLVTRKMISQMRPRSVIVDVAIDQGGACETSRPTSHTEPIYLVDNIVHYCVTNMPGAVARTATLALTQATLSPVLLLAQKGLNALNEDRHLRNGLNTFEGHLTNEAIASDLRYPYVPAEKVLI